MATEPTAYRGRFAPSPTGPLHFGSLVAAVGSYLDAVSRGGTWLVRMEDLDPPREVPGAADGILHTLDAFGFEWQGEVMYQSRRQEAYRAALADLERFGAAYGCACSRKEVIEAIAFHGAAPGVYPGTCRSGPREGRHPRAMRVMVPNEVLAFDDRLQGRVQQDMEREVGDFVIRRADGLFAYQLAVVVDDAEQRITDIVRGSDLLDSTPRQLLLQRLLELPSPRYLHLPVAVNASGQKLSKQTHAPPLDPGNPVPALVAALRFLGQHPPPGLADSDLASLWRWASSNWDPAALPQQHTLPERDTARIPGPAAG